MQITNTDMARVLTIIESSCPNALSKKASTDEVMVNFDALTPRCFHEVNAFILACFLNLSGAKKNKKRKSDAAMENNTSTTSAVGAVGSSNTKKDNEMNDEAEF